jgi:hypothetical protein
LSYARRDTRNGVLRLSTAQAHKTDEEKETRDDESEGEAELSSEQGAIKKRFAAAESEGGAEPQLSEEAIKSDIK